MLTNKQKSVVQFAVGVALYFGTLITFVMSLLSPSPYFLTSVGLFIAYMYIVVYNPHKKLEEEISSMKELLQQMKDNNAPVNDDIERTQ